MSTDDRPRGVIRLGGPSGPPRTEPAAGPTTSSPPRARTRPPELTRAAPHTRFGGRGALQANLNWLPGSGADLNLCCLISFKDGTVKVVQALADDYGSLTSWPYVALDHDDRTGESSDGETLRVNPEHRALFDRLLFFVYIYEGAVDFRRLGAAVSVTAPGDPGCRILLDESPAGSIACAVALVTPDGAGLTVRREVRWFPGHPVLSSHEQIDRAYGFGVEWTPTEKPPRRPVDPRRGDSTAPRDRNGPEAGR
ncbi:tellurium resistance protein TerA [Streptomyces sp. NPDC091267]|uniref:tellurium resistance protein TerA n=1 Tax=unclassified Streptomyces TaxID=2593676 RepID=UPI0034468F23